VFVVADASTFNAVLVIRAVGGAARALIPAAIVDTLGARGARLGHARPAASEAGVGASGAVVGFDAALTAVAVSICAALLAAHAKQTDFLFPAVGVAQAALVGDHNLALFDPQDVVAGPRQGHQAKWKRETTKQLHLERTLKE
jgi:hypothetical protein